MTTLGFLRVWANKVGDYIHVHTDAEIAHDLAMFDTLRQRTGGEYVTAHEFRFIPPPEDELA